MKRAAILLACFALILTSCGLKVPTTIVAGSGAENGPGGAAGGVDPSGVGGVPGQNGQGAIPSIGATASAGPGISSMFDKETEGITNSSITICVHVPITGAAPIPHDPSRFGQFYFDYVNRELGGIYGRKVTFKAIDDHYNPAGARQAVENCHRQGAFFYVGAAGTDQIVSVAKWAERTHEPYLHGATSVADLNGLKYHAYVGPAYEYQHKLLADMLVANYGKTKNYAQVRVDSPYFKSGADAFAAELKKLGANYLGEIKVQKDESDFTSTMAQLQNWNGSGKKADIVNNFTTPNIWIKMLKQKGAYDPLWTAVSPVAGFNIVAQALSGTGRAVVFHAFNPACECATYSDTEMASHKDLPWYSDIENFLRIFKQYSKQQKPPPDDFDYASYLSARAIYRLMLEVGPQPTRSKLWALFKTYKEADTVATIKGGDGKSYSIPVFPGCPGDFTRNELRMGAWKVNVLQLEQKTTGAGVPAGVWKQIATCVDSISGLKVSA